MGHNSLDKINEFYTDENLLKDYINEGRIRFYKEVAAFLRKRNIDIQNKKVVDVGCGTGHLLHFMKEEFGFEDITGLEYSPEAINVGKKLFPSFQFHEFDIYKGWNEKFDVILCTEVLEHLLYPVAALNNILNMLPSNGVAFITVPNGRIDTFGGHINFWSPESWDVFMKANTGTCKIETGIMQNNEINYVLIHKSG